MKRNKPMRCPYCGSSVILRSADGIYKYNGAGAMLYVCSKYPACDSYVRVIPGTKIPGGSLANKSLRALRIETHRYFDLLFQTGIMSRNEAYGWLACMLQMPLSQAHIGNLGEYYCQRATLKYLHFDMDGKRNMLDKINARLKTAAK